METSLPDLRWQAGIFYRALVVYFWLDPKTDEKAQSAIQASPDVHSHSAKILKLDLSSGKPLS
jgi:hypothetical protein